MILSESLKYIYPELILLGFGLFILIAGLFSRRANICMGILSLAGIIISGVFLFCGPVVTGEPVFSGLLVNDGFSRLLKEVFIFIGAVVVLISMGHKGFSDEDAGEYYFLLLTAIIAMMLAVSSNNLLIIYIAFELLSLASYILVGFNKGNILSNEAGLKYFLFGTLSTGIMLYGISFIYGIFGTTDLLMISNSLSIGGLDNFSVIFSLMLIFAGLAFKMALVPFHMWVPDAYQGSPTPVTALISTGPKVVGFAVLIRIFLNNFFPLQSGWTDLIVLVSIFTMTTGNIIALAQSNVKRMLGYSSVAQAGYILMGFAAGTLLGGRAILFYVLVYAVMNLGAFGCIALIYNSLKSESIEDYAGLYKRAPFVASLFAVFLLSLAGLPPLAGFLGKFFVFAAAIEAKLILLALVGIINSVVALYYYVRVIKFMYLNEPAQNEVCFKRSVSLEVALVITFLIILAVGLFPHPVMSWIAAVR